MQIYVLIISFCSVYSYLARAASILKGLGFDAKMQNKMCKDFSGGW